MIANISRKDDDEREERETNELLKLCCDPTVRKKIPRL